MTKRLIVIPARMDSRRMPGKPLILFNDKALLHYTYDQAKSLPDSHVVVTSPDREIGHYCGAHGLTFFPSSKSFRSGTERVGFVAEMARKKNNYETIVNWQVDEPTVNPTYVRDIEFSLSERYPIGTLASQAHDDWEFMNDPNRVKVRTDHQLIAQTFTRNPLPGSFEHIGVYVFLPEVLESLSGIPPTPLANIEDLEQLSWLDRSYRIGVLMHPPVIGINTEEDVTRFAQHLSDEAAKCQSE